MMEQYGEFFEVLCRLKDGLEQVRAVWQDQTAVTYDSINDNTERYSAQVWLCYSYAVEGYNAVKTNYNEAEFEHILSQLDARIRSV